MNKPQFLMKKAEAKLLSTGVSRYVLVVDIGTYLIKYSMFAIYDNSRTYLLHFELKDSVKVVEDGIVNYNLFKRDLGRKIESLSELASDIKVIIIPPKGTILTKPLPSMELKDKKSEMVKDIKNEFKDIQTPEGIYDWASLKNDEERDISSVYLETISSAVLFPILTALVDLKVKDYKVVSPMLNLVPLTGYTKDVTAVIDVGHSSVSTVIISDSVILKVSTTSAAGREMNSKFNLPLSDVIKIKHSSLVEELPSNVHAVFETLKKEVTTTIEDFNKLAINKVDNVIIIGGHANTNIESLLGLDTLRIPVTYPELDLENSSLIPREVKAYLMNSYGAIATEVDCTYQDNFDNVDYSEPKDSMIMKIKKVSQLFNTYKYQLIGLTASVTLAIGIASFGAGQINELEKQYTAKANSVTGEVTSLSEQVSALESQYNTLMSSASTFTENENVGDLVDYIASITPPNFTIKEFTLNSSANTGMMRVTSESELVTSSFITLLQDPTMGAFQKVNIVKVEIEEMKGTGRKYYNTHLFLEGRKY